MYYFFLSILALLYWFTKFIINTNTWVIDQEALIWFFFYMFFLWESSVIVRKYIINKTEGKNEWINFCGFNFSPDDGDFYILSVYTFGFSGIIIAGVSFYKGVLT